MWSRGTGSGCAGVMMDIGDDDVDMDTGDATARHPLHVIGPAGGLDHYEAVLEQVQPGHLLSLSRTADPAAVAAVMARSGASPSPTSPLPAHSAHSPQHQPSLLGAGGGVGVGGGVRTATAAPQQAAGGSMAPCPAPAHPTVTVVLDGANIGWQRGKDRCCDPSGVAAALRYFRSRGFHCFAFLPAYYTRVKPRHGSHGTNGVMETDAVEAFQAMVDREEVVLTPPQADDDKFIITYAADRGGYVVSNDMFRDHIAARPTAEERRAAQAWVKAFVIPYTFVAGDFVPDPPHMRDLMHRLFAVTGATTAAAAVAAPGAPHAPTPAAALAPVPNATSAAPRAHAHAADHRSSSGDGRVGRDVGADARDARPHVSRHRLKAAKADIASRVKRLLQPAYTGGFVTKESFKHIAKTATEALAQEYATVLEAHPHAELSACAARSLCGWLHAQVLTVRVGCNRLMVDGDQGGRDHGETQAVRSQR